MLIHSVSSLYFWFQINAVRSIHIPWLAQYHRHTLTSLLAGLWRNRCWKFGKGKHFSLPQNMQITSGTQQVSYSIDAHVISLGKTAGT